MDGKTEAKVVRPTADGVRARLAEAGVGVPEECVAGTLSNLITLQDHVLTLRTFPLDDFGRPAPDFQV